MHRSQASAAAAPPPAALLREWIVPNATIFVSSAAIMMIELVAGRIIARHLGASVYTWTSVIGIVLAGIAVGNYLGGLIADRHSSRRTLAVLFVCGSAMSAAICVLDRVAENISFLWTLSWPVRVASHVAIDFFIPTMFLGMISPVIAKIALDQGRSRGRTIGDIYAFGVVGSLVGTFIAGFFLIAALGTLGVVWSVAIILAVMALMYDPRFWAVWAWAAAAMIGLYLSLGNATWANSAGQFLGFRLPRDEAILYQTESDYSYIEVVQFDKDPDTRGMHLDTLLHSQKNMEDPTDFRYAYEKVYLAITKRLWPGRNDIHSLTIGGGGYVYPEYMSMQYPEGRTDVVEIDPAVTEAAMAAFGLPRDTKINCYHEDGRVFIDRLVKEMESGKDVAPYDVIYCDAVNDYSVPYQLTTREFIERTSKLLRPDGAYLVNMIDIYDSGLLLGALISTMKEVYPYVNVFVEGYDITHEDGTPSESIRASRNTFIISGTKQPFNTASLGPLYQPNCQIYCLDNGNLQILQESAHNLVLTDAFAPVENLLAPVVKESALSKAVGNWQDRINRQIIRKDYRAAIELAERVLKMFPDACVNLDIIESLAEAYYLERNYINSIDRYLQVLRANPFQPQSLAGLISCYIRLEQYVKALPYYENLLELQPNDISLRASYAVALVHCEEYDKAKVVLLDVLQRNRKDCDSYNALGAVYSRLGDQRAAMHSFRQALECNPNHVDARKNVDANLGLNSAAVESQIAVLKKQAAAQPDDATVALKIADAYYSLRMAPEALEWYDQTLRMRDNELNAIIKRADVLFEMERLAEALAGYRGALEISPDNALLQENIRKIEEFRKGSEQSTTAPS